jgi:hypothetical protein
VPDLTARHLLASAGGLGLAAATRTVAAARQAAKPLHPHGEVAGGRLHRSGATPPLGVPILDAPGEIEVLVRASRAIGLPAGLPDVHGLALRVPAGAGHGDLLFASTGLGPAGRFVLTASRTPYGRPMTTLLPYRTARGPVLLAAVPRGPGEFDLLHARGTGPWRPLGRLVVSRTPVEDALVSFDPLLNTLPGLDNYEWVRRLREPAYGVARGARRSQRQADH